MSVFVESGNKGRVSLICPQCGNGRELRPSDARRAIVRGSVCQRCHLGNIAALGYQATRAKYGEGFAVKFLREYRLKNPSSLERLTIRALKRLNLSTYQAERETLIAADDGRSFLADFTFVKKGVKRAVEVNGEYVHQFHADRDAAKLLTLRAQGWEVLTLTDSDIKSAELPAILARFLGVNFQ